MLLSLKIISIQLAWLGSIAIYLGSEYQVYRVKPIHKAVAWAIFLCSSGLAILFLNTIYHWLTAIMILLMVWMIAWVVLALWPPYCKNAKFLFSVCSLLLLGITLLEGIHVV
ncbi:MAG: hypothetical protein AAGB12_13920 [Pseudomonadota bacterium]